jgi:MYXO-CTERM domain-containing protein
VGQYRFKLDDPDLEDDASETSDDAFTPTEPLAAGEHTLYLQESDATGNWSTVATATTTIDLTPPPAPVVSVEPVADSAKPTWTWTGSGAEDAQFRYRLNDDDLTEGTVTTEASFTPPEDLYNGEYTLYVQERDAAGNWSAVAEATTEVSGGEDEPGSQDVGCGGGGGYAAMLALIGLGAGLGLRRRRN